MNLIGFLSFTGLKDVIEGSFSKKDSRDWKIVGLLFVKEGDPIAVKFLKPFFQVFNSRSGTNTDFYWAGWSTLVDEGPSAPLSPPKASFPDLHLSFNAGAFDAMRADVMKHTKWIYSGGADLILFSSRRGTDGINLDLGTAMCIDLRAFEKAGIEPDILFERIFTFADSYDGAVPILGLFLNETTRTASGSIWTFIKSFISKEAGQELDRIRLTAVRDIGRSGSRRVGSLGPPSSIS